jgi:uncharacterized membrane-anchored protein
MTDEFDLRPKTARWRNVLAVLGLLLVLAGYNLAIQRNEWLLAQGTVVRLELAPVDPRAFLTGDYMQLDYAVAREAARHRGRARDEAADRYAIVTLDPNKVAKLVRLQDALLVRFRKHATRIGTDAWYFEEGRGKAFEAARYGEFRVADDGQMLLTTMLDAQFRTLR